MKDIVNYYKGSGASYVDNDGTTQTPYNWANDPAKKCRKTFALFVTTGTYLGQDIDKLSPLPSLCNTLTYTDAFPTNTCFGYNTDLSGEEGFQNIRTYILHTTFYGSGAGNAEKLKYSAYIGGGEYFSVSDPAKFEQKLEEAILNILANASSASTVATLTTQTRGSSSLTQAYFYPRKSDNVLLKWIGYLRLFWSDAGANLREDSLNYAYLDEKKDKILTFRFSEGINPPQYVGRLYGIDPDSPISMQGLERDAYLRINSCDSTSAENRDNVLNEDILAIWNAQISIRTRPDGTWSIIGLREILPDDRNIKTSFGDESGFSNVMQDFSTTLGSTLQPMWSYDSFCSNNPNRWCFNNSDCNYCTQTGRACPTGSNSECNYCSGNTSLRCDDSSQCYFDYGSCQLLTKYCTNNPSEICSVDSDCVPYAVCDTTIGTCQNNPGITCSTDLDCSGACKGRCSLDNTRFCSLDTDCKDDYGTCITGDTCNTGFTCQATCDTDCAGSVIKFVRGYDKPSPKGGTFRIRHECRTDADCPSGQTCDARGVCSGSDITKTLKLGDIVYSTPRISPDSEVNGYDTIYKDETYTHFIKNIISGIKPIVIVGANDGMVHAFKMSKLKDIKPPATDGGGYKVAKFVDNLSDDAPPNDLGREVWAYIPYNSIPYLNWYCQDNYCHIPMVDARFTVMDVSINGDPYSTKSEYSWRRLLIGAMGVGGKKIVTANNRTLSSSIFVLDITDPMNPSLLWERPLPDNTLTTSNPAIIRFGDPDKNGSWYLVIGSGPQGVTTNRLEYKSGNAFLYVFDLKTGQLMSSIDTGLYGYAIGDLMAVDMDLDYNVDAIYFGTYRGSGPSQTGHFYRFRIRNNTTYNNDPTLWNSSMLTTVINVNRPIFAGPEVTLDTSGNIWLYFGTGLYLTMEHAQATIDNEWIYGFIETKDCWMGTGTCPTYTQLDFLDTTNIEMKNAKAKKIACFCSVDNTSVVGLARQVYDCNEIDCSTLSCGSNEAMVVLEVKDVTLSGLSACDGKKNIEAISCVEDVIKSSYHGWRRAVRGWKIFSKPYVGGGLVDLTAFEPKSTVCSLGGDTHLMTIHYTTGTPPILPAIVSPMGTTGSINDLKINISVNLGKGVPPLGESLVALALAEDAYAIITQVSGSLPKQQINPAIKHKKGYVLWNVK